MNNKTFDTDSQRLVTELRDCKDVIAHLGDFVDNELALAQRMAVEAHLDSCADCAAFFASYNHVVQSAAELREPEQPLPVDVQNRLRKALNERLGITLPYIA